MGLTLPLTYKQGLRLALAGPGSIEAVKWKSHSRANQFNLSAVPTGLFYLVMTIVGSMSSYISSSNLSLALLPCDASQ